MTATESLAVTPGLSRAETQAAVQTQNWKLLEYFNFYRVTIALGAVAIGLIGDVHPFGSSSLQLFQYAAFTYFGLALIALYAIRTRKPAFDTQANVLGFADVALITMLMHAHVHPLTVAFSPLPRCRRTQNAESGHRVSSR